MTNREVAEEYFIKQLGYAKTHKYNEFYLN